MIRKKVDKKKPENKDEYRIAVEIENFSPPPGYELDVFFYKPPFADKPAVLGAVFKKND